LKTSIAGQFFGAVVIACVLATLAGCSSSSRVPTAAGVVEEVTRLPDGGRSYRLADGASVVIASQKLVLLGGEPLIDELLLAGTDPDGRQWVAGLTRSPNGEPGCFWFTNNGRDSDGWIETYDGFRLPKAVGFYPAYIRDGNYQTPRGYFCLNESGEVTGYIPA
jgi:hypothetical protein